MVDDFTETSINYCPMDESSEKSNSHLLMDELQNSKECDIKEFIPEYQCMREMTHVKGTNHKNGILTEVLPKAPSVFRSTTTFDGIFNKGDLPTTTTISKSQNGLTENSSIGIFGEDTVIKLSIHQKSLPKLIIVGVLDGHGGNLFASKKAGELYVDKFKKKYLTLVEFALTNHSDLRTLLTEIASEVEIELIPTVIEMGGCTMTITGIVESHVNRIVFNMNLGDSSTYMRVNDEIQQINTDHSADNIDAYTVHYFENKTAGHFPSSVVYGRFNVRGKYSIPLSNKIGKYEPFVMFDESDNKTLVINSESEAWINKVYVDYVGGIQSVRKYIGVNKSGKKKVLLGYGHVNWGSTIMGDIQCLKSHGDLETSRNYNTSHIPDINIYCPKPHEDVTIITGSDGLWDLMWTMEIFEIVHGNETPSVNIKSIMNAIKNKCTIDELNNEGYSCALESDGKTLKSKWDDVSFAIYHSPGDLLCKNLHDRGILIHDIGEACLDENYPTKELSNVCRSVSASTITRKKFKY